ncbi:MAG: T9SS type A sorting domain-containing protein [Crocinitomicaceae bacterium]|nr:T9SS type A sorting domain-containing protein [Crocinitomicaceae bacterium]
MKKIILICFVAISQFLGAQTFESFNFSGITSANGWTVHSGTTGFINAVNTTSDQGNSLAYPGLPASVGNRMALVAGNAEDINKAITGITGTGYYSFLLKVSDTLGLSNAVNGDYFTGFGATAGATVTNFGARTFVKKATGNNFLLGILNASGGTVTTTFTPTSYPVGTTLFVVLKLDNTTTPITASLYVNPTPGAAQPAATATNAQGTSAFANFASIYFRQAGTASSGTGNLQIDELRVGSTWADVTPSGVISPNVLASTAGLTGFNQFVGTPSTEQNFNVSGSNLTGNVNLTVAGDYQISLTAGSGFGTSLSLTPTTGTVASTPIYVRLNGGAANASVNSAVIISSTGATNDTVSLNGSILNPAPTIFTSVNALSGFTHFVGNPSSTQTFDASGNFLTTSLTITASGAFEVSQSATSGFANSISITPTTGTIATTPIYVRLNGTSFNANQTGTVILTTTGATSDTLTLAGNTNDYVVSTIALVTNEDANGVATSLGTYVSISGIVHCIDFDGNAGYSLTVIDDNGDGINLFKNTDVNGYQSAEGDSIRIKGKIEQFNGLTEIVPDSILVLGQNATLQTPIIVTSLSEATESKYIKLENLSFVTPITTFPSGSSTIQVTDGSTTFALRIDADTDIPGGAAPQNTFSVIGVCGQYDNSSPYTAEYQLFPCGLSSFTENCVTPSNLIAITMDNSASAVATGVTYQWINCAGNVPIAGATNQSFSATESGSFAVIVSNGACSDTSDCFTADLSGIDGLNTSGFSIVPNPSNGIVNIELSQNTMNATITIAGLNGQIIETFTTTSSNSSRNVSYLNEGMYLITVATSNGNTTKRIVIKK